MCLTRCQLAERAARRKLGTLSLSDVVSNSSDLWPVYWSCLSGEETATHSYPDESLSHLLSQLPFYEHLSGQENIVFGGKPNHQ